MATSIGQHLLAPKESYYKHLQPFKKPSAEIRVLIQKVVSVTSKEYLKTLRNSRKDKITRVILVILQHLLTNYGNVAKDELCLNQNTVWQLTYHPNKAFYILFSGVSILYWLSKVARSPFSKSQKMNLVYIGVQKAQTFKCTLKHWNPKRPYRKLERTSMSFFEAQKRSFLEPVIWALSEALIN